MLATLVAVGLWFYTQEPAVVPVVIDAPIEQVAEAPEIEIDAREHQRILGYLAAHAEVESRALMPYVQLAEYEK